MDDARILDRYRLVERLAAGGTAEVWRAHDEQLDRPVAVKRLHAHLLPDRASRLRLAAEARAVAALSHPVIVGVYDVDAEGASPALVMELVEGESLATRIGRSGPLPATQAALLVADLAEGLFHAHQQGVIHRDVKPANVLLTSNGGVKLVDFGIAHSLADAAERLTQTGTVVGTLRSMAPEQLAAGPITPRTDLYGLGVVLHEAVTGRPPYPASTPLVLADAQRAGLPPLDAIDPELGAIVASCLAFDPADRPLHARALADALRRWATGATTVGVAAPLPRYAPAAPARAERVDFGRRRLSRWLPMVTAGALGLLLVAWIAAGRPPLFDDEVAATSPAPTPAPTTEPTPLPAWATDLAAEIADACGDDAMAGAELAAMGENAAEEEADETIDACEEAAEGDGGGNGNEGRGNGNEGRGNGNEGRGNGNGGGGNGTRGRDG